MVKICDFLTIFEKLGQSEFFASLGIYIYYFSNGINILFVMYVIMCVLACSILSLIEVPLESYQDIEDVKIELSRNDLQKQVTILINLLEYELLGCICPPCSDLETFLLDGIGRFVTKEYLTVIGVSIFSIVTKCCVCCHLCVFKKDKSIAANWSKIYDWFNVCGLCDSENEEWSYGSSIHKYLLLTLPPHLNRFNNLHLFFESFANLSYFIIGFIYFSKKQ